MFKKFFIILTLIFLFITANCFAGSGATKITSNTVSFNTTAKVVTFNTVVNNIMLTNESYDTDVYVTLTGLGITAPTGEWKVYVSPTTVAPAIKLYAGSTVFMNFNTRMIGFLCKGENAQSGYITYTATTDTGIAP